MSRFRPFSAPNTRLEWSDGELARSDTTGRSRHDKRENEERFRRFCHHIIMSARLFISGAMMSGW